MLFDFTSLKYKIIIIFIIPAMSMIYFSSASVKEAYTTLDRTDILLSTVTFTKYISELIHELQKERGLSAAYLGKDFSKFRKTLSKQRVSTDKVTKEFITFFLNHKKIANKQLAENIKKSVVMLQRLSYYRQKIDQRNITFYEEMYFFSSLIKHLLLSMPHFHNASVSVDISNAMEVLVNLIHLKESAGIERGFLSNIFSEEHSSKQQLQDVQRLIIEQDVYYKNFLYYASIKELYLYQKYIKPRLMSELQKYRDSVLQSANNKLIELDGMQWYLFATDRINKLNEVIRHIMQEILDRSESIRKNSQYSLWLSGLFWCLSLGALFVLSLMLKNLISKEQQYIADLKQQKVYYTMLSSILETMIYSNKVEILYEHLCSILVETGKFQIAWVGIISQEKERIVPKIARNISLKQLEKIDYSISGEYPHADKASVRAYLEKNNIILSKKECKDVLNPDMQTVGAFPIYRDTEIIAVLSLYSLDKEIFDITMIQLLERVLRGVTFTLNKIQKQEEQCKLEEELRIASYAFESQEAMTITDADSNIIKVNQAFTEITGYQEYEVIGKNPSVLKSSKHDSAFYQNMWHALKKTGKWKGEIFNRRKNGEIYPELLSITKIQNAKHQTTHYIAQFLDISHIKNAQKEAEHKAEHDALTGIANRAKLLKETEVAFIQGKHTHYQNAFIFLDIDNFKQINDFYGHSVGDEILIEIAKRLQTSMGKDTLIARFGGDEFAIILFNLDNNEEMAVQRTIQIVKDIQEIMQEPIIIEEQSFIITFSMGINIFPDHEKTVQEVVSHADIAMYQAKKSGRNQFSFFDQELNLKSKQFIILEKEIAVALEKREFELYYQPKVDLQTSKIVGLEVLLRWNHPKRGLLYPDSFLSIAYETKHIDEIEKFVIHESCRQLGIWKSSKGIPYCPLSINITPRQFQKKEFVSSIKRCIEEYEIDASFLELELLEDTLMEDIDNAIKKIKELKILGIKFAIDDFGTGYSSMTYLQKLPVDTIKIDKSFVMDTENISHQEIIKMIINFAKIFNLKVVAEGVENKASLEFLKEYHCDMYQGYYFSRAVNAEKALKLLLEYM